MSIRTIFAVVALALVCSVYAPALGVREGEVYTLETIPPEQTETREADSRLIAMCGISLSEYELNGVGIQRVYTRRRPSRRDNVRAARALADADALHATMPSLHDVVAKYGPPPRMVFAAATAGGRQYTHLNAYYGDMQLYYGLSASDLREIRFTAGSARNGAGATPYRFRSKISVDSSLDEVLALLGQPARTVKGTEIDWTDRVLSSVERNGGTQHYICYDSEGVRFFFWNQKVMSLYLFAPGRMATPSTPASSGSAAQSAASERAGIEPWADVRKETFGSLGAITDFSLIRTFWFSASSLFPGQAAEYARMVLEKGKNPGLGVRALHERGITGKGVNVAIIDQNLPGTDHPEYAGKVVAYHDTGCGTPADRGSMHGPAVLSLLVGTSMGTAPDARVYFAAAPSWTKDAKYKGDGLRWIIEENAKLPADAKIRVVSVSAAPSGPGSPFDKNNDSWDAAVVEAEAAGILVLDCTSNHGRIGPGYFDPDRPDDMAGCSAGFPGMASGSYGNRILAPTSYRTQAEEYNRGSSSYQYTGRGGLSWGIPYAAGVLAMGWQVNPTLTGPEMMALLEKTAYSMSGDSKMINPPAFIAAVEATVKR